jgi:protein-L-isoaspartate(D-aspartate) O-methyltransferase
MPYPERVDGSEGPMKSRSLAHVLARLTIAALPMACSAAPPPIPAPADADPFAPQRERMVTAQIEARGVHDPAVLAAMRRVPRHLFVPESLRGQAYDDTPLPIGLGQTISQPYIVGLMTELARPRAGMKVLEVGTGSGYQAAVLATIVGTVDTIEIVPELGRRAAGTLRDLDYTNVRVFIGDGFDGRPQDAPFDAIVVTAAPEAIPPPLLEQLAPGGRLVIPIGSAEQELVVVTKTGQGFRRESVIPVRFVPMTGKTRSP